MNRKEKRLDDIDRVLFEHDMEKFVELYEQKASLIGHDFNPRLAERARRKRWLNAILALCFVTGVFICYHLLTYLSR